MNPSLVRCALCGWVVLADWDSDPASPFFSRRPCQWANQFRARQSSVSRSPPPANTRFSPADEVTVLHTPDGLLLTGVSIYHGLNSGAFCAPFDKDLRWNDAGFEPSDDNSFSVLPHPDIRGRHGIVFHDACWSLLEAVLQPASVSLQRLFDVCSSLPVPQKCRAPTWGHGFAGVIVVDKTVHFPWEDRYEGPESAKLPGRHGL